MLNLNLDLFGSLWRDNFAVLDRGRCLRRFKMSRCEVCIVSCPVDAITDNGLPSVARDKCNGCGVCVTKCAVGALSVPSIRIADIAISVNSSRTNRIVCSTARNDEIGVKVPCLGFLDAAMLIFAARKWGEVILDDSKCGSCSLECTAAAISAAADKANDILVAFGRTARVKMASATANSLVARASGCSRRELFAHWKSAATKSLVDIAESGVIPFLPEQEPEISYVSYRSLIRQISFLNSTSAPSSCSSVIGNHPEACGECSFCRICVKACPEAAIFIVDEPKAASLVLDLVRCSGCGLCTDVCPSRALIQSGQTTLGQVLEGQRETLYRTPKSRCRACDKEVYGKGDLCLQCQKENELIDSLHKLV